MMRALIPVIVSVIMISLIGSGAAFAGHEDDPANTLRPFSAVTDGSTYTELDGPSDIITTQIGSKYYALVTSARDNGVQIIDITDPASPSATAAVTDGVAGFTTLSGADNVAVTQIGSKHYALVTAFSDDGVQIINITDPASPTAVSAVTDGAAGFTVLNDPSSVAVTQIGSKHYALVASNRDDGVQIIDITDPANPSATAAVTDGDTYTELNGAVSITTTQIGSKHYALVASSQDDGVQIIDITDPASPTAAAVVERSRAYQELDGANDITTTQIGSKHYALVSAGTDDGVQIIDITDPTSPQPAASVTDDADGFTTLDGANDVTTAQVGSKHYAFVTSGREDGVQIIDITDPTSPTAVAAVTDGALGGGVYNTR